MVFGFLCKRKPLIHMDVKVQYLHFLVSDFQECLKPFVNFISFKACNVSLKVLCCFGLQKFYLTSSLSGCDI